MKKINEEMEFARNICKELMKRKYTPSWSSKIGSFFDNIFLFIIVCLAIIFRPLNLLIIGIITLIIFSII